MKKQLHTSYYARSWEHPKAIAISASVPKWLPRPVQQYKPLLPTWQILNALENSVLDHDSYIRCYFEILAERGVTPQTVANDLPEGSVLLCYEKSSDACHRHHVRDWLNESGILDVTELDKHGYPSRPLPFDFNMV
jgi:hypothetical protein